MILKTTDLSESDIKEVGKNLNELKKVGGLKSLMMMSMVLIMMILMIMMIIILPMMMNTEELVVLED